MQEVTVFIALQAGPKRLVVDGPLHMLSQLMAAFRDKEQKDVKHEEAQSRWEGQGQGRAQEVQTAESTRERPEAQP